MDPISVRDIKADGNARIHVGNSSVTHVHNYAEGQALPESTPTPYSLIPFSRDLDFVTRGDILNQITQRCSQPGGRAALVGLGGVGKSQLAIEYAYQTTEKSKDGWVFWVHAGTRARVEEGFRAIADAIKLPDRHQPKADIPQLLHTWLSNEKNGKWLMILDSADDHEVFYTAEPGSGRQPLASYLPQSSNGSILLTTRDHGFAFRLTGKYENVIKVGPMEPAEAFALLEKKLGVLPEPEVGEELVRALDCIPLAINQAASYIQARAPRCTIRKYLVEFHESDKKSVKLMAHDSAELRRDGSASNAIMKTWQISFDHIHSKQPSAADLLSLMSFFDYQSIPEAALNPEDDYDSDFDSDLESNGDGDELANQFSALHLVTAKARRDHTPDNSDFDSDSDTEDSFEDDIAMLRNFCLISVKEAGTEFEMHRLVQLATKKWLAATKQNERFKQLFIHRVSRSMPLPKTYEIVNFRNIIVHMQIAASLRPNKANTRAWCNICYRLAWLQSIKDQFSEAKEHAEKAYDAWAQRKGPEHEFSLVCRRLVADILLTLDQIFESESILVEVLEIQKRKLGDDHQTVLSTMVSLASNYVRQGRYTESEKLEFQAVELAKRTLGPENQATLTYMTCLARSYASQDRLEEAEELDLATLAISKRVFGPAHAETLEFMAALAGTYELQERYNEALDLELEVLALAKAASQPNNLMIALCMSRISDIYRTIDMPAEAENMDKAALDLFTAELGSTHPHTFGAMASLADDYHSQGQEEEANSLLDDMLNRATLQYGNMHAYTIVCMSRAASIYFSQRKYAKSAELRMHTLSYYKTTLGCTHWEAVSAASCLAKCLERQFKYEEALTLYKETFTALESKLGFEHSETLKIAGLMASLYSNDLDLNCEAIPLLERISEAQNANFGHEHPDTLRTLQSLSSAQRKAGLLEEAEVVQRRVLEIRTASLGVNHWRTLGMMDDLADTLQERENFEEAEKLFQQALAGYNSYPRGRRIWAPLITEKLGKLYIAQRRFEDALNMYSDAFELYQSQEQVDEASSLGCLYLKGIIYAQLGNFTEAVKIHKEVLEAREALFGQGDRSTIQSKVTLAVDMSHEGEVERAVVMLKECADTLRECFGPDDPDILLIEAFLEDPTSSEGDED